MSLIELWKTDRPQVQSKRIDQLLSFAGDGRLTDGSRTSAELRQLLAVVPSDLLGEWALQVLNARFDDSGLVLQDLVNELGRRLGFEVTPGRYRGRPGQSGFDGLWHLADERSLLVECKTSSTYQIELTRIASYRDGAAKESKRPPESFTFLLVVGRDATDALESQGRGSRFAWDVRLIGVESLLKLVKTREAVDDPLLHSRIQEMLVPQEFTRLDRIVDLVFATAEDAESEEEAEHGEPVDAIVRAPKVAFHGQMLPAIEKRLGQSLVKSSRVIWKTPDGKQAVSCQASRSYSDRRGDSSFWFGLKRSTASALSESEKAWCAFGLGTGSAIALIPFNFIKSHFARLSTSADEHGGILHHHIRFLKKGSHLYFLTDGERELVPVDQYVLPST